jgi:hypothetical protein
VAVEHTLSYYDKILVAIAASLGVGTLAGQVAPGPPEAGLFAGALLATVFVYLGVFYNPPLPRTSTRAKTAAVLWHVFLALLFLVATP